MREERGSRDEAIGLLLWRGVWRSRASIVVTVDLDGKRR